MKDLFICSVRTTLLGSLKSVRSQHTHRLLAVENRSMVLSQASHQTFTNPEIVRCADHVSINRIYIHLKTDLATNYLYRYSSFQPAVLYALNVSETKRSKLNSCSAFFLPASPMLRVSFSSVSNCVIRSAKLPSSS